MSNNCECGNKVTPFRYASKEIFFTNNLKFVLLDINIRNNKNSFNCILWYIEVCNEFRTL